jgi:hypothetical protein
MLCTCPRCHGPLLAAEEYYGRDQGEEIWSDAWRLFPPPDKALSVSVPRTIRVAYAEAQACFRAKAYAAAVLMCRKALEAAAQERGVKTGRLKDALKELKDRDEIDGRLYEWANELRAMGNAAAHGLGKKVRREDAQDVLSFTEAIIDFLFVFRKRFEEFQARRKAAARI